LVQVEQTALIEDDTLSGTYHLAGAPEISWAGFAREIMPQAGLACRIEEIPTSAYPAPTGARGWQRRRNT
jgi:dTDP-4-dehydrorhamnose reductase